tara:strand:+ start:417 stop:902 length:486 start_codon:yes stop_codon:yes gene_type:complete
MSSNIPITHMYTDKTGHTRFKRKLLPLEPKTGLGSVGLFSSLFVNQILNDNSGDIKMQFAVTPVPDEIDGEGPKLAHTAPRRQLVITLDGYLEFKSCDVDIMDDEHQTIITRGQILLADDLEGAGHVWKFLKDEKGNMRPWVRCYVHLGEEYEHFMNKLKK